MNIRRIIKEKGMTQQDVANKLGISKSALSQMIDRPMPSRFVLLAEAIGCEIADFFKEDDAISINSLNGVHLLIGQEHMYFNDLTEFREYFLKTYKNSK